MYDITHGFRSVIHRSLPACRLYLVSCSLIPKASRNTVVELQSGDRACTEVWTLLCDISRKEFQKVYDRLGVTLEEYGESFYNDRIPGAIDALAAAGLVSKDDGADIVRLEHFTYPLIVRKRDGERVAMIVTSFVANGGWQCSDSSELQNIALTFQREAFIGFIWHFW